MNSFENLTPIQKAVSYLKISEELVMKFIKNGIVKAIVKCSNTKLNQYNFRRLSLAVELHEKCLPPEVIE
jgi:hypothetical protein